MLFRSIKSFHYSWLVFGVYLCEQPTHCWCQLLIQIADLNCWCQLIADEDDEGSVLCGEFGRQRYLDHLDRKDLRIFPDLESIQHMLISLAPSYFWFPAAICHLLAITRHCALLSLCCGLFGLAFAKTCRGFFLVTSVFDCCNNCQGFGQFKTGSSLNIAISKVLTMYLHNKQICFSIGLTGWPLLYTHTKTTKKN